MGQKITKKGLKRTICIYFIHSPNKLLPHIHSSRLDIQSDRSVAQTNIDRFITVTTQLTVYVFQLCHLGMELRRVP